MALPAKKSHMNFAAMSRKDVPQGRNGKHNDIVTKILSDLDRIGDGGALKVPLSELPSGKEKVTIGAESRYPQEGAHGRDRKRRRVSVCMERAAVGGEIAPTAKMAGA